MQVGYFRRGRLVKVRLYVLWLGSDVVISIYQLLLRYYLLSTSILPDPIRFPDPSRSLHDSLHTKQTRSITRFRCASPPVRERVVRLPDLKHQSPDHHKCVDSLRDDKFDLDPALADMVYRRTGDIVGADEEFKITRWPSTAAFRCACSLEGKYVISPACGLDHNRARR